MPHNFGDNLVTRNAHAHALTHSASYIKRYKNEMRLQKLRLRQPMYSYCYHKKKAKQKSTIMGVHCVAVYTDQLKQGVNAVVNPYLKKEKPFDKSQSKLMRTVKKK